MQHGGVALHPKVFRFELPWGHYLSAEYAPFLCG